MASSPVSGKRRRTSGICLLVIFSLVLGAASFLGRFHWVLDNLGQFRWQWGAGFLVLAPLSWWEEWRLKKRPVMAVLCLVMMIVNAALVVRLMPVSQYFREAEMPPGRMRFMTANLYHSNPCRECFLETVRKTDPDFLAVQEVSHNWAASLEGLRQQLPHRVVKPRYDAFGIGFFSRWPVVSVTQTSHEGDGTFPMLRAVLETPAGPVAVMVVHPPPPAGGELAAIRNHQLQDIADDTALMKAPVVVLGDFNATPWSPHFRVLEKTGGLHNALFLPTWPSGIWPLYIPIDHILVKGLDVLDNRTARIEGSDHLARVTDVAAQALNGLGRFSPRL
ncbi:MAG: endonuclease/exonuclease/phosphatase family protein [Pseudomonadota bacterium]|nr:endonuclease/exonuclease/phosphatase family protein [Pseudomonadota bacterium]